MRILYHGGTEVVESPRIDVGRNGLDFGKGFYATARLEQAEKWALRAARQRLQFIVSCRGGYNPAEEYDYVEGGVANDRVIDMVEGYINGTVDAEHALVEMSKHQPNHQICFLNAGIVRECLIYKDAIRIDVE